MKSWERVLVRPSASLREAIEKIDTAGSQGALVVDERRRLLGILTDGDIRRGLLKGLELGDRVDGCMFPNPKFVRQGQPRSVILSMMRRYGLQQVPIVDAGDVVVGLEVVSDYLITDDHENWVVVMAGGRGTRLGELTDHTPKPMLRIGDRPLLETILGNYVDQGFRRFYLAVNYKAEIIEGHFGDGSSLGAEIRYLREPERLGTAGALSLLPEPPTAPTLVTNGDLLVKLDYADVLRSHVEAESVATMVVREYEYQIPFGVVHETEGLIKRIDEKPTHRALVCAGMYVLSPEALPLVPAGTFFDMPSLFDELIEKGLRASCYHVSDYWMDIGHVEDYERAKRDYTEVFDDRH